MASAWLLSLLCFGFAAVVALCAALVSRRVTASIFLPIYATSLVLLPEGSRQHTYVPRLSPISSSSLSTSAAFVAGKVYVHVGDCQTQST